MDEQPPKLPKIDNGALAEPSVRKLLFQLHTLDRKKRERVAAAAIRSSRIAALAAVQESLQDDSKSMTTGVALAASNSYQGDNDDKSTPSSDSSSSHGLLHCVRCHENFDPDTAGYRDCVMEEHCDDVIEVGSSGLEYMYACCHQDEDSAHPCWVGSHITSWGQARVVENQNSDTYHKWNDDGFWMDQELAPKWKAFQERAGDKSVPQCFECDYAESCCENCCTCGKAGLD